MCPEQERCLVNSRQNVLMLCDRIVAGLIVAIVLGGALGFGGMVWWFRPGLVMAVFLLVFLKLAQYLVAGKMPLLKSPLTLLGMLALGLGMVQLAPLPASVARWLSPVAHEVYSRGFMAKLVLTDDPEAELPEAPVIRSPASLDRSATLRWLVSAACCLGIFWTVSHYTDRLGRLYLIWGLVAAGFLLNGAVAIVQITNRSEGLYGFFLPGYSSAWTPSFDDALDTPATTLLRDLADPGTPAVPLAKAVIAPAPRFLFGTMMGGSGAFLALGALALPLTLAITLHIVSPRGSRERLSDRLGQSNQGSLLLLLVILMAVCTFVTGLLAGPWYGLPLALGLAAVGLPALIWPGARGDR